MHHCERARSRAPLVALLRAVSLAVCPSCPAPNLRSKMLHATMQRTVPNFVHTLLASTHARHFCPKKENPPYLLGFHLVRATAARSVHHDTWGNGHIARCRGCGGAGGSHGCSAPARRHHLGNIFPQALLGACRLRRAAQVVSQSLAFQWHKSTEVSIVFCFVPCRIIGVSYQ